MAKIKIAALGGLGENGKNLYIVEVDEKIFILDAGLKYPEIDMYGVDAVVPNISYLIENKHRIQGIFISHGHEDNIGALPYLLKNINLHVFGTHFTISLIENLLTENKMDIKNFRLYRINENKTLNFGTVEVNFFNTSHSFPESVGIAITTKDGVIVYATDFNFVQSSDPKFQTSFDKIIDLANKGILVLLSESVGAGSVGRINNDSILEHHLINIMNSTSKRVIIGAFSSDLVRIQKAIDVALLKNRKISFIYDRNEKTIFNAVKSGYLHVPAENLVYFDENVKEELDNHVIFVTGSRHEPYATLVKMVTKEHRFLQIHENDKILIMCPPISGTEKYVTGCLNTLCRFGADVKVFDRTVLRSSHASPDDLKMMYSLLKPHYIFPIKGEYRHMSEQKNVAINSGYEKDRIILVDNGEMVCIEDKEITTIERITVGDIFVDGSFTGDVNESIIKNREALALEGAIIIDALYDVHKHAIVKGPIVITKGFVAMSNQKDFEEKITQSAIKIINSHTNKKKIDYDLINATIITEVEKIVFRMTKRKPVIMPIIIFTDK